MLVHSRTCMGVNGNSRTVYGHLQIFDYEMPVRTYNTALLPAGISIRVRIRTSIGIPFFKQAFFGKLSIQLKLATKSLFAFN